MKKVENLQSYLEMVDFYSQGILLNLKKESYFIFYIYKEDVKTDIKNMHNHLGHHVIVLQKNSTYHLRYSQTSMANKHYLIALNISNLQKKI